MSGEEEITCVGIFSAIAEGENIEASGDYTDHPTYGKQFKVESFEEKATEDEEAIELHNNSEHFTRICPQLSKYCVGDSVVTFYKEI